MHLMTRSRKCITNRWVKPFFISIFILSTLVAILTALAHLQYIPALEIRSSFDTVSVSFCRPEWESLPEQPYELGRLLNLESFRDSRIPLDGAFVWNQSMQVACQHPGSVLNYYHSIPSTCARQPHVPFLKNALRQYGKGRMPERFTWMVSSGKALLVQFDPDTSFSDEFKEAFTNITREITNVVLMPSENSTSTERINDLRRIAHEAENDIRVFERSPKGWDDDLLLMSHARHILLHVGTKSALGALVAPGTVYYSDQLKSYADQNQFKWLINDGHRPRAARYPQEISFRSIGPVAPSCCQFKNFGHDDGEKVVCANAHAIAKAEKCWVLSIGCRGRFDFEEDVVKKTKCDVHIFDCTGTWRIPDSMKGRATLSRICIGKPNQVASGFKFETLAQLIARASKLSGFEEPMLPALLKMDVEGFEMPVLRDIVAHTPDKWLPEQMAIEIHLGTVFPVGPPYEHDPISNRTYLPDSTVMDMFGNLSNRGYELVHRADNPFCWGCSEITMLHRSGMPMPAARNEL